MQVLPILNQNNSQSFKSLKYLNGIKTQNALYPNLKEMIPQIESECTKMKNVDIILTEDTITDKMHKILLDIKTPRFLKNKFEQFYKEEGADISGYKPGSSACIYSPTGAYRAMMLYEVRDNVGMFQAQEHDCSYNPVKYYNAVIQVAKIIDRVIGKIKSFEDEYGINFLDLFERVDKMQKEAERDVLIDRISNSNFTFFESAESMDNYTLGIIKSCLSQVDSLKHYKMGINYWTDRKPQDLFSLIVDTNSFIDIKYADYYRQCGYSIKKDGNSYTIKPMDKKDITFHIDKNRHYGDNPKVYSVDMNHITLGDRRYKDLVNFACVLDEIANLIIKGEELSK